MNANAKFDSNCLNCNRKWLENKPDRRNENIDREFRMCLTSFTMNIANKNSKSGRHGFLGDNVYTQTNVHTARDVYAFVTLFSTQYICACVRTRIQIGVHVVCC